MKNAILKLFVLFMLSFPAQAKVHITPVELENEILVYANTSVETGGLGLSQIEAQEFLENVMNLNDPSGYLACHRVAFRFAIRSNLEDGLAWSYKRSIRFADKVAQRDDKYDYIVTFQSAYVVVRHLLNYDSLGQRTYAVEFSRRFAEMPKGIDGLFVFVDAYLDYRLKNPSEIELAREYAEEKLLEWQQDNFKK